MKRVFTSIGWLACLAVLLAIKISLQAPAAHASQTVAAYFGGGTISVDNGILANPPCGLNQPGYEGGKCSDLSSVASQPTQAGKVALMLSDLQFDVNDSAAPAKQAGAAFIIESALYGNGAHPGSVAAGIADAVANFGRFSNIVNQYNGAGQLIFMNLSTNANSAIQSASPYDSGYYLQVNTDTADSAVFTNSSGGLIYGIRLNCGNVIIGAALTPLPPSVTLAITDNPIGFGIPTEISQSSGSQPAPAPHRVLTVFQDDDLVFNWASNNSLACYKQDAWSIDDGSSPTGAQVLIATGSGPAGVDRGTRDTDTVGTKVIYISCLAAGGARAEAAINVVVVSGGSGGTGGGCTVNCTTGPSSDQFTLKDTNNNTSVSVGANSTQANILQAGSLAATVGDTLVVTNYRSVNVNACASYGWSGWGTNTSPPTTGGGIFRNPLDASVDTAINLVPAATATPSAGTTFVLFDCTDTAGNHYTDQIVLNVTSPTYHPFLQVFRGDAISCPNSTSCTSSSRDQQINSLGAPAGVYAAEQVVSSAISTTDFCSSRGFNFGSLGSNVSNGCQSGPYVLDPSFNSTGALYQNLTAIQSQPSACQSPQYPNGAGTKGPLEYIHATLPTNNQSLSANGGDIQTFGSGSSDCGASGVLYTIPSIPWGSGSYFFTNGIITHGTATIVSGGSIYINGNIYNCFTSNIAPCRTPFAEPGDIPNLALVAQGNIYIDHTVSHIDATLYAGGSIFDCATPTVDSIYQGSTCNQPLTIHGAVVVGDCGGQSGIGCGNTATASYGGFELARNPINGQPGETVTLPAHVLAFPPPVFADISSCNFTCTQTLFQENNGRF